MLHVHSVLIADTVRSHLFGLCWLEVTAIDQCMVLTRLGSYVQFLFFGSPSPIAACSKLVVNVNKEGVEAVV